LKKARPSASSRRKGVLRLPPEGRASFASFGFLRKASPLAAFRRKRQRLNLFLNVLREASPLAASFGKLHLWRGGGFPKEAPEVKLVSERPSGSFTSGGFLPKEGRPSASFGKLHLWRGGGFPKEANLFPSFGFLREASPLAGWRFLRKDSPLAASRRTCILRKDATALEYLRYSLPSGEAHP